MVPHSEKNFVSVSSLQVFGRYLMKISNPSNAPVAETATPSVIDIVWHLATAWAKTFHSAPFTAWFNYQSANGSAVMLLRKPASALGRPLLLRRAALGCHRPAVRRLSQKAAGNDNGNSEVWTALLALPTPRTRPRSHPPLTPTFADAAQAAATAGFEPAPGRPA